MCKGLAHFEQFLVFADSACHVNAKKQSVANRLTAITSCKPHICSHVWVYAFTSII